MKNLNKLNREAWKNLLEKAQISDLKELSFISGVPQHQLWRIQHGLLAKLPLETVLKISLALNVPLNTLLEIFLPLSLTPHLTAVTNEPAEAAADEEDSSKPSEVQKPQAEINTQQEYLFEAWKRSSLESLESWLLQWPTAKAALKNNPEIPATKLLPLIKPVEQLLEKWGVETVGSVGEEVIYDPRFHQLIDNYAQEGDLVKVRYVGYSLKGKLLYRARVVLVAS